MDTHNPYHPPLSGSISAKPRRQHSANLWSLLGAALVSSVPFVFGIYGLYRENVYAASLPPGQAHCGMGALAAMMIILVGTPVFGLVGAIGGWITAKLWP